mgnify:CR=1 FL=1
MIVAGIGLEIILVPEIVFTDPVIGLSQSRDSIRNIVEPAVALVAALSTLSHSCSRLQARRSVRPVSVVRASVGAGPNFGGGDDGSVRDIPCITTYSAPQLGLRL